MKLISQNIFLFKTFMSKMLPSIKKDYQSGLGSGRRQLVEKYSIESSYTKGKYTNSEEKSMLRKHRRSLDLSQKRNSNYQSEKSQHSKSPSVLSNESNEILSKYFGMYGQGNTNLPRLKNSNLRRKFSDQTQDTYGSLRKTPGSARRNFIIRKQSLKKEGMSHINKLKLAKFRKCVNAVLFIIKIKAKAKSNYNLYSLTLKLSHKLLKMIDKQVNKYYADILKEPFLDYEKILSKKLNSKKYDYSEDIISNIMNFSNKLANSSLRRDILNFITLISMNHAYVPIDCFCEFQLLRLDFHPVRPQLNRVSNDQLKMIVGFFMGIKILYLYIFYNPSNVSTISLNLVEHEKKLKTIIRSYRSFFYWTIMEMFEKMKTKNQKFLEHLMKRGWEPVLIDEESPTFFQEFKHNHKKKYQQVSRNMKQWIQKISMLVIRNREIFMY